MKRRGRFDSASIDLTGDDDNPATKIPLKRKTLKKEMIQKHERKTSISLTINKNVSEKENMRQALSQNPDYFGNTKFVQNLQDPKTNPCRPTAWFSGDTIDEFLKTTHGMLGNNPEVIAVTTV